MASVFVPVKKDMMFPYPVIVNDEQLTDAPLAMLSELKFKSAPDVPTVPVMTTVALSDFSRAKYPAVFVDVAVPDVMALAVAVPPDDAPNAGLPNVISTI